MVKKGTTKTGDKYDEYMVLDGALEKVGDWEVDLSNYQPKEDGKGLSTNDFTNELLAKLNGIADEANKYVHPTHEAHAAGFYKVTVDCLKVLTYVLIWAAAVKTYAIVRWGETIGCDLSDILVYTGGAFGVELLSLALKKIFAKKREEDMEDG